MKAPFDLRQLRYFVAVAQTLSFRRAAESLFISQPPLSRQIRALEESLGVRLFERNTSVVRLTREGEQALERARRLLADADRFAAAMGKLAGHDRGIVRIGVSVAVSVPDRKRLSEAWKREMREEARIEFAETKALWQRLRQGQFDYALLAAMEEADGFSHMVVHVIPLVVVLPRGHPAARKARVRLADLQETPFFWLPRSYNPAYYDRCARVFARKGFAPRYITVQPGQVQTLERIAEGEGCTLMSQGQLSRPAKGVIQRPLEEGELLGIPISAWWRSDDTNGDRDRRGKAFSAIAKRVFSRQS